jgi:two-component system sensor histidine kinase RstB
LKSLYLRIYLTLVALLLAFAFGSAWLFQRQIEQERGQAEATASERLTAIALLIHRALPPADAPVQAQAEAVEDWGRRLRMPFALQDAQGVRIAASAAFERRERDPMMQVQTVELDDGRSLLLMRFPRPRFGPDGHRPGGFERGASEQSGAAQGEGGPAMGPGQPGPPAHAEPRAMRAREDGAWPMPRFLSGFGPVPPGEVLIVLLVLLFLAVAISAYPVVRRLTRRLERLKQGVEQFGAGRLDLRVDDGGSDEVGALASSFNRAAERIELLLRSHQSLLANASHELRSPLARMKMAFAMLDSAVPAQRERLRREIDTNISELDALVEEVLLASRLEAQGQAPLREPVDLLGLAVEEAAASGAELLTDPEGAQFTLQGEERLLRRALRNLLENARRYGGEETLLSLRQLASNQVELRVCDRGPGVPHEMRTRIFEPFFRLPGHAEQAGGVGLGLSLVKQIAERHGGQVRCEDREGGGSCFVIVLPAGMTQH